MGELVVFDVTFCLHCVLYVMEDGSVCDVMGLFCTHGLRKDISSHILVVRISLNQLISINYYHKYK